MPLKMSLALYIGGMGARDKNFYNEYIRKVGFEADAVRIQDLYLAGKKDEAIAAVPDALVDALHLVGTAGADPRALPGVEGAADRHAHRRRAADRGGAPHGRAGERLADR